MTYLVFSRFFLRRASHFKGCIISQIFARIMKIYSDFWGRLIFRSPNTCWYMVIKNVYIYNLEIQKNHHTTILVRVSWMKTSQNTSKTNLSIKNTTPTTTPTNTTITTPTDIVQMPWDKTFIRYQFQVKMHQMTLMKYKPCSPFRNTGTCNTSTSSVQSHLKYPMYQRSVTKHNIPIKYPNNSYTLSRINNSSAYCLNINQT